MNRDETSGSNRNETNGSSRNHTTERLIARLGELGPLLDQLYKETVEKQRIPEQIIIDMGGDPVVVNIETALRNEAMRLNGDSDEPTDSDGDSPSAA